MSADSRIKAARQAIAALRAALYTVELTVDELEAEVQTLRAVVQAPRRALISCTCLNPACGKQFKVRASDLRAGNKAGKFCCLNCSVAAKAIGRPRSTE